MVIFIVPAKPWMNGTVEGINKEFDRLFWRQDTFTDLPKIQAKFKIFSSHQNKFYISKLRAEDLKSSIPKRMLREDFEIDLNNTPLVACKIHFIRVADCKGDLIVLNEHFHVGKEYIGDYIWQTVDTREQALIISYNDKEMVVRKIKRLNYPIDEMVYDLDETIFISTHFER